MSAWNNKLPEFIALLDEARGEGFWIEDFDLKYLTIRIDTRDNGWLLFKDGPGQSRVRIEPQRVVDAIQRHRERFPGNHKPYQRMVEQNDADGLAEPSCGTDPQDHGTTGSVD